MSLWAGITVPRVLAQCRSILHRMSRERFVCNTPSKCREREGWETGSGFILNCRKENKKEKRNWGAEGQIGFREILKFAMSLHQLSWILEPTHWMLDARIFQEHQRKALLPQAGPGPSFGDVLRVKVVLRPGARIKETGSQDDPDEVLAKTIIW